MNSDIVKNKRLWIPPRVWGVCIWIMADGQPLSDGDGFLSAEGYVDDKRIESKVREAAKYWSGTDEGEISWVHGARKITGSERDDQVERLNDGLVPDPYEDSYDQISRRA